LKLRAAAQTSHPTDEDLSAGTPAVSQRRHGLGGALAFDEGVEDAASAEAQDVGDHRIKLDVGLFQRLLDALNVAGAFAHDLLGRLIGHETGFDHPMRHQIGQPCGIVHICLTTGHILYMRRVPPQRRGPVAGDPGVGQNQRELAVGENMPDRLPVNARRLHGDMRRGLGGKPLRQSHQVLSGGFESLDGSRYLAIGHVANAGNDGVLVNSNGLDGAQQQSGHPWMPAKIERDSHITKLMAFLMVS